MSPARSLVAGARVSSSGRAAKRVQRVWQIFTVLAVAALTWWFVTAHQQPSANRYRTLVLELGWIGTSLAVLAAALSVRKRAAYQGIGKMSAWLTGHVYLGILSAVAIFYHSDFRAGGPLSSWLLGFFSLTVVSGLMGWWFSRTLPVLLTAIEERPAIMEDLLSVRAECLQGMLELGAAGSPEFRALVDKQLMNEASSWGRMLRFYRRRSTLAQELPIFQKEHAVSAARLKQSEQLAYQRATEYALRVNKMNAEIMLQRAMRGWLTFHIVCTATMFGLAAVHIFTALYY
jgi:cytochrome b561